MRGKGTSVATTQSPDTNIASVVAEAIRGRRSVRGYRPDAVPEEALQAALDAARWAPSPHNAEPWRFVVVRSADAKHRLAESMGQQWERDLSADGLSVEAIERERRISYRRITSAPVVLLVCLTDEGLDQYPDPERARAELLMATQSLGAAVQNVMLEAHARGLATGWMCAPLFCPTVVVEALGLPTKLTPQGLITLGYAAVEAPARDRRPMSELVIELP